MFIVITYSSYFCSQKTYDVLRRMFSRRFPDIACKRRKKLYSGVEERSNKGGGGKVGGVGVYKGPPQENFQKTFQSK